MSAGCAIVDVNIALTLHLIGWLWSEDDKLKSGLRARGFDRFFMI